EELLGAVWKRVPLQRAEGDRVDPVERAPDARLGKQQKVPSGEVDGIVGRSLVWHRLSRHAPMRAIRRRNRSVQDGERLGRWTRQRVEEASQMGLLRRLPREPE